MTEVEEVKSIRGRVKGTGGELANNRRDEVVAEMIKEEVCNDDDPAFDVTESERELPKMRHAYRKIQDINYLR